MIRKRTLIGILLAAALLGIVPALSVAAPDSSRPAQTGTNLAKNPGFEGLSCQAGSVAPECLDNWTHAAYDGSNPPEVYVPQGWVAWWRTDGGNGQIRIDTIANVPPYTGELPRIHSGYYAMRVYPASTWTAIDSGIYQVVTGLTPGATVQFSAYAHGWSCDESAGSKIGYTCGDPYNMSFQVGIEPNGATGAPAGSVIWGGDQWVPDHYGIIGPVTAQVGAGGNVCVYLRVKTKWAFRYQEAYWDDASLVYTSQPTAATNTPVPVAQPTAPAGPPPTPRPTSTPRPDGAIVHVVQSGDTLSSIALQYGVTLEQLQQLNAGSIGPNNLIVVGQELVVSLPAVPPTATPLPTSPAPVDTPLPPAPTGASICLLAFHDRNGDTFRDETTEELLPNSGFTIADASGVRGQYTTDGISEPYCFAGLPAGTYRVIMTSPPGYVPNGSAERDVAVAEGANLTLPFGNARGEGTAVPEETPEAPTGEEDTGSSGGVSLTSVLSVLAKISGALVLILATGMVVLFFLNRRRM